MLKLGGTHGNIVNILNSFVLLNRTYFRKERQYSIRSSATSLRAVIPSRPAICQPTARPLADHPSPSPTPLPCSLSTMARPEEKSQSMLHRYLRSRAGDDGVPGGGSGLGRPRARRPHLATLCEDVDEAERWRRQVLRDVSRKVGDIQNRTLLVLPAPFTGRSLVALDRTATDGFVSCSVAGRREDARAE